MVDVENSLDRTACANEHDCWLAMRSAYTEYRRASEAIECHAPLSDGMFAEDRSHVVALERREREAFERYLETRMEFLEFRFDQQNSPGRPMAPSTVIEPLDGGIATRISRYKWVVETFAFVLLFTIAFASMRENRQVRELEADRDNLRDMLSETQEGIRSLGEKLAQTQIPQKSVVYLSGQASTAGRGPLRPPAHGHWRRLSAREAQQYGLTGSRSSIGKAQHPATNRQHYNYATQLPPQLKTNGTRRVISQTRPPAGRTGHGIDHSELY